MVDLCGARLLVAGSVALALVTRALAGGDGPTERTPAFAVESAAAGGGQVVHFRDPDAPQREDEQRLWAQSSASGVPIVMMHGMGDFGSNPMGMAPMRRTIARVAATYVRSVELCSTPQRLEDCPAEDQSNGFLMNMDEQVEQFARVVRSDPQLVEGFNAIGFSQGNLIIRGYVHRYNNPPVRSFVSMHGVMMGVAGLPQCPLHIPGLGLVCKTVDALASLGVYTGVVQRRLAQANYYRDPKRLGVFRSDGRFLKDINNEVEGRRNSTYAERFRALERLVLVMAEGDTMVQPKESEHFGYLRDGSMSELLGMREAPWYREDWFGLRALDEAGKIDLYTTPGNHLRFSDEFLLQMVRKYFGAPESFQI